MAIVSRGFQLSVTLADNGANETTVLYELSKTSYADAVASATVIINRLTAVSDGVVVGYRLTEVFQEESVAFPASGVQAEVSASMTTLIANQGAKKASYRIPMPKANVFTAASGSGANIVNTNNVSVIEYHQLFQGGAGQHAYISDGETAGALQGGVRVTRSARRG